MQLKDPLSEKPCNARKSKIIDLLIHYCGFTPSVDMPRDDWYHFSDWLAAFDRRTWCLSTEACWQIRYGIPTSGGTLGT